MQTDTPLATLEFFCILHIGYWDVRGARLERELVFSFLTEEFCLFWFMCAFLFISGKIGFMCIKHWEWVFFLRSIDRTSRILLSLSMLFYRFHHFVHLCSCLISVVCIDMEISHD